MKRSNISARRDWGDEEIVKEPEKEGREGKGGGERGKGGGERREGRRGEREREAGREGKGGEERGGVLETHRRKEGGGIDW